MSIRYFRIVLCWKQPQIVEDVFSLDQLVERVWPLWQCLDLGLEQTRVADDLEHGEGHNAGELLDLVETQVFFL